MLTVAEIETFFTYFYKKKYSEPNYKYNPTATTKKDCENFLKIIDKEYSLHSVGKTFLWDYFIFQFQYWHDLTDLENSFSKKILIAWIIGKKAFDRWKERNQEYDWQIEKAQIIHLYQLDKSALVTKENGEVSAMLDSSKLHRKLHYNKPYGFVFCIEYTTLFDPMDSSCLKCIHRTDCKELLKVNYPKLYNQRIKG